MSNYELVSMEAVSNAEATDIIKEKEEVSELTYREDKIKEYLKTFNKLSVDEFNKARKEILDLDVPRLDEEHIMKILDIFPQNGTELRAVVSHSGTVLVDENVDKILGVLKKYRK